MSGLHPSPLGHGGLPPPHLSPEALMALKKTRMDPRDFPPFMNGGVHGKWPQISLSRRPTQTYVLILFAVFHMPFATE